jgi:hypothetical protein
MLQLDDRPELQQFRGLRIFAFKVTESVLSSSTAAYSFMYSPIREKLRGAWKAVEHYFAQDLQASLRPLMLFEEMGLAEMMEKCVYARMETCYDPRAKLYRFQFKHSTDPNQLLTALRLVLIHLSSGSNK